MARWLVRLHGEKIDLQDILALFGVGDWRVLEDDGSYYLASTEFDSLTESSEVLTRGTESLHVLNGAAMAALGGFRPVAADGLVTRIDDDGKRHQFIHGSSVLRVRSRLTVAGTVSPGDPLTEPPQSPSDPASWFALSRLDDKVERALRIWGSREHSWHYLYNVYEIIQSDIGGEIWRKGWAAEPQIEDFKRTANSQAAVGDEARHGQDRYEPPPSPMSLSQADSLVRTILLHWLRSKRASWKSAGQ